MSSKEKDIVREAKVKAARFCAYRERAPLEVREKLVSYGLDGDQLDQTFNELVQEGFLNEQRFASAYANGKLRIKKWGKLKIRRGLEIYQLDPGCIFTALKLLPEIEYMDTMKQHIERKGRKLKENDPYIRKHKIAQFVISKGFEPDLVWDYLKSPA